jgi:short-subunit dehydrogenase involved in D-alanine esterification of teichoic acids
MDGFSIQNFALTDQVVLITGGASGDSRRFDDTCFE